MKPKLKNSSIYEVVQKPYKGESTFFLRAGALNEQEKKATPLSLSVPRAMAHFCTRLGVCGLHRNTHLLLHSWV